MFFPHRTKILAATCCAALLTFSPGCGDPADAAGAPATNHAVAVLQPVGDSGVTGEIHFTAEGARIHVHGEIRNLSEGAHGFHIHEFGDLTAADDGTSAGGHYDPEGHEHGAPMDSERHVGDLGNIDADPAGLATVDKLDTEIELSGAHSILGRAVVVHAGKDTFEGDSGEAGSRVAFGVIGIADGD